MFNYLKQKAMIPTKEEILRPHYRQNNNGLDEWIDYDDALTSMDEYAEQECIGFGQWVSHSDWVYLPSKKLWYNEEDEENITPLTDAEIYQYYKAQLSQ